jgi:hypothetical protein
MESQSRDLSEDDLRCIVDEVDPFPRLSSGRGIFDWENPSGLRERKLLPYLWDDSTIKEKGRKRRWLMSVTYDELLKQVDTLQIEEQLRLASYLLERARRAVTREKPKRKWAEIRGMATYPMLGEDAQAWVTRTRREWDEREAQWRNRE